MIEGEALPDEAWVVDGREALPDGAYVMERKEALPNKV